MTPAQVRMARAALDLTPEALCARAGLSVDDLRMLEHGGAEGSASAKLRVTLEAAGIIFLDQDGVRYDERQSGSRVITVEEMNSTNDE